MSDRHLTAVKHLNSRSSSRKRTLRSQVLTTSKSGWNGLKYFCYVKKCLHTGTSAGSFVDALHCKILPEQMSDFERGAGEMVHKSQKKKKRGSRTVIITCSSVSRCQFESDRTARTLGVRPSLSVQRGERTAFGWSAGKRTRSPTSAPPTCFQTPEIEADKTSARSGIDIRALGKSEKRG